MVKIKKIIFSLGIAALLFASCDNGLQSKVDELTLAKEQLESEKSKLQDEKSKLETEKSDLQGEKSKLETVKTQLENELKKTKDPDAKLATKGSTSADVVKVRLSGAQGFGTRWATDAAKSSADASRKARSALNLVGDETLIKLNKDGSVEEALVLPDGLADWCNYQPVREVYQCTYLDKLADDAAKGLYIVFSWYIDFWQLANTYDEEGNEVAGGPGPEVGQLLYVKPDGTIVDVFAKKDTPGKINKIYLNTYLKENDDRDYIKFDTAGNAFMIITDQDDGDKIKVARFNPLTGETTYYNMPAGVTFIRNFELKSDGTFFYINAMVEEAGKNPTNNVYALPVKAGASPITLFTSKCKKENWGVSNLCYNPLTNQMIFFVDDWLGNDEQSGLYICKDDVVNGLSIDKHLYNVPFWSLQTAFEYKYNTSTDKKTEDSATYITKPGTYTKADGTKVSDGDTNPNKDGKATYNFDAEYDYAGMLKHLKSFYGDKKVYFTLDYFKKYANAVAPWEGGPAKPTGNEDFDSYLGGSSAANDNAWFNPYEHLYATTDVYDSEGNLKKETYNPHEEGYTVKDTNGVDHTIVYDYGTFASKPSETKTGTVLTEEKALKYLFEYKYMTLTTVKDAQGNDCIKEGTTDESIFTFESYRTPYSWDFSAFLNWNMLGAQYPNTPIWFFFTDKEDGTWNGPIYPCGDETFAKAEKGSIRSGELVYTKDGFFLINGESSDWDAKGQEWTSVVQVTNKDGQVIMTTPTVFNDIRGYVTDNWSEGRKREEGDPWYKSPIKSTQLGFTLRSEDGRSIYYYDGTTCKKIVDGKKLNLATVYSFSLNNDSCTTLTL